MTSASEGMHSHEVFSKSSMIKRLAFSTNMVVTNRAESLMLMTGFRWSSSCSFRFILRQVHVWLQMRPWSWTTKHTRMQLVVVMYPCSSYVEHVWPSNVGFMIGNRTKKHSSGNDKSTKRWIQPLKNPGLVFKATNGWRSSKPEDKHLGPKCSGRQLIGGFH